jgi:hypothetical protein
MLDRLALAGVQPLKKIHEHCDFSMRCFLACIDTTDRLLLTYASLLLQFARRVSSSECLPRYGWRVSEGSGHPCGLPAKFGGRLVNTPQCGGTYYTLGIVYLTNFLLNWVGDRPVKFSEVLVLSDIVLY